MQKKARWLAGFALLAYDCTVRLRFPSLRSVFTAEDSMHVQPAYILVLLLFRWSFVLRACSTCATTTTVRHRSHACMTELPCRTATSSLGSLLDTSYRFADRVYGPSCGFRCMLSRGVTEREAALFVREARAPREHVLRHASNHHFDQGNNSTFADSL